MKLGSKRKPRLLPAVPRASIARHVAAALALSAASLGAQAAGLGPLRLLSALGQPLRAEIDLNAIGRDEANSLSVRLANADAFAQANVEYGSALNGLRFSIQRRANGQPYVLVTSTAAVNEPFVDMLVELSWGSGRLVREYTLLLDPPESRTATREVEPGATIVQAQTAPTRRAQTPRASAPSESVDAGASGGTTSRASSAPREGDYVVRRGDTALSIARDTKPADATVDQMAAALFRDNPQAFGGNVNILRAGSTLRIPDAASVHSIDRSEARRTIVAQSDNFGAYSQRLARGAADVPAASASGSPASGRLTTRVDDVATPAASGDRLQLSRPDLKDPGARNAPALRAGAGATDLATKDRELTETKTRLAQLEKSVQDLQALLALKSQTLSDLQKGGSTTTASPAPAATSPAPAPSVAPAPAAASAPSAVALAPTTPPAPAATAPAPAPSTLPAPASDAAASRTAAEPGFLDHLMENSLLVAGLAIVLVLLVGGAVYTMQRRRKLSSFEDSIFVDNSVLHPNSVFGTTGGQSVDTANSGFHSNFVPVGGKLPERNEVDPVAEADVYIAYGRDAQAEEILREALRADAGRHAVRLKLLEIYAKRGDAKNFETMASELYAKTGGQGDEWNQAAVLGQSLDPQNPLYRDVASGAGAGAGAAAAPAPEPAMRASSTGIGAGLAAGAAAASALSSLDRAAPAPRVDHTRTDPMPREAVTTSTNTPAIDLDFDLGFSTDIGPTADPPEPPPPSLAAPDVGAGGLDFDVGAASRSAFEAPFTASNIGTGDPDERTAVNLPAFRALADQKPSAPSRPTEAEAFTASDIFGSSIVAVDPLTASESMGAPPIIQETSPPKDVFANQFDKTEPLDAFSMSAINLELDKPDYGQAAPAPDKTEATGRGEAWQAMATKLDLAMAYTDIGDKEGARELLEEVVRHGDAAQAERAKQLITTLG